MPRHPCTFSLVGSLTLALAGGVCPVHAQQEEQGFALNVSYQLQRDNNLFRLPPGADAQALIGSTSTSDTLLVKSAGLSFDQRYSLQQVHAEIQLVDYDFQRFSQYDLTATNYGLRWDWAYTPQLQGSLLADRSETVNSFDGSSTSLTSGNRRTQTRHGLDLRYDIDDHWRLQGGAFNRQDRRDQATVGEDDYRQNTLEAGVRRSFGTGSHITARVGRSDGSNLSSTAVADDRFRQNNLWLDLLWVASGLTTVDVSLQRLSRSHTDPALDYSGLSANGSVKWRPTGKLLWTFTGASTLDSYQTASSTHARTDKLGVSGLWTLSARTAVRASVQQSRLQLLGHPSTGGVTSPRRDRTVESTLGITWQPDELFSLDASLQRRQRNSNQALYDYGSTLFSVGLTARF